MIRIVIRIISWYEKLEDMVHALKKKKKEREKLYKTKRKIRFEKNNIIYTCMCIYIYFTISSRFR